MNRISLASGVVPEFGPLDTIAAAAAGGFDAVGLWIEPPSWTAETTRACTSALADTGLDLLDVEVVWLKPGAADPDHLRCIDIGAELGARNVLVVSSDPNMEATAPKFAQLCAHARPAGMRVALEFGLFTEVRTIADALAVLDAVDDPTAALLIDPLHLVRSGGGPEDVAQVARSRLPYAQLCDAPAIGASPADPEAILAEAIDGRLQTGEGGLPLAVLMQALPRDLPLSIELRSKALRDAYPDAGERAAATARATRAFLDGLGARG